jgi:hypothetical protein
MGDINWNRAAPHQVQVFGVSFGGVRKINCCARECCVTIFRRSGGQDRDRGPTRDCSKPTLRRGLRRSQKEG